MTATLINKPLEICLKIAGIWPYSSNYIGPLILLSILVTSLPFQCWDALSLTNNPVLLMDSLSDIVTEILILIKFTIMWLNNSKIKCIIHNIIDDYNKKVILNEWKVLARYCSLFCNLDLTVYLFATIPYYIDIISNSLNKPARDRNMLFQSHYPFDYHASPIYEIINMIQAIQGGTLIAIDSLSKGLLVACILHIVARIRLLECHINTYSLSTNDTKRFENLRCVIKEHLNILSLVGKINSVYRYVSLFQIIFSNVIICVTGFVIITAVKSANMLLLIKFISFIIAMLLQSFTFCFIGQYLRNKGESIFYMIYSCLWYKTKPKEIEAIIFILSSAQRPLALSGGKIFELSIKTFVQIIKTSFSYLSVLRAMYS